MLPLPWVSLFWVRKHFWCSTLPLLLWSLFFTSHILSFISGICSLPPGFLYDASRISYFLLQFLFYSQNLDYTLGRFSSASGIFLDAFFFLALWESYLSFREAFHCPGILSFASGFFCFSSTTKKNLNNNLVLSLSWLFPDGASFPVPQELLFDAYGILLPFLKISCTFCIFSVLTESLPLLLISIIYLNNLISCSKSLLFLESLICIGNLMCGLRIILWGSWNFDLCLWKPCLFLLSFIFGTLLSSD